MNHLETPDAHDAQALGQPNVHPMTVQTCRLGGVEVEPQHAGRFPGFRVMCELPPHHLASRWLTHREADGSSHVVYQLAGSGSRADARTFMRAVNPLREVSHPHLLPITFAWSGTDGSCMVASPYVGSAEGILTLERLLKLKPDGRLSIFEGQHLADQLLSGIAHAHERGLCHGPLGLNELLVDTRGSVRVELYALANRLEGNTRPDDLDQQSEVRSALEVVFRSVTASWPGGSESWTGSRPADRAFADWLELGLRTREGYAGAQEALDALRAIG